MTESQSPREPDPNAFGSPQPSPSEEPTTIEELPTAPPYRPVADAVKTASGSGASVASEAAQAAQGPHDDLGLPVSGAGTTAGAAAAGTVAAATAPRRGLALRWVLALVGVIVVAAGSLLIVTLAGGRPATSVALGYMPSTVVTYTEVRLDLPGDQRQKLASFLHTGNFPGFADQAQIEPKIEDVFDRIVRLASKDQQTYTGNIKPWFGGQLAVGQGVPSTTQLGAMTGSGMPADLLAVATITDRAKAVDWVAGLVGSSGATRSTYNGADVFSRSDSAAASYMIAITDKVLLAGGDAAVKAAVDGNGNGPLATDADVKAALATVDRDYAVLSLSRLGSMFDSIAKMIGSAQPGVLDKTQIDETLLSMVPAWQASTFRFDDDALTSTIAAPAWKIGYDAKNEPSDLLGHVPANAIAYFDGHDVGPAYAAIVAKFRALPEAKTFFDQYDQALSLVGGADAVFGWWGDTAVVVAPGSGGTIGGGLLIHPRDAGAAERLLTTLRGFLSLAGGSSGVVVREEDHGGTKITILDFSAASGTGTLPPGYKAEMAWAVNQDVAVLGYGSDFVASVLDAGPGHSLADDARFKALLSRVGVENISTTFVDVAALRKLIEPLIQASAPADKWAAYVKEIQPYLAPFDAVISGVHKDGGIDRGTGLVTVH